MSVDPSGMQTARRAVILIALYWTCLLCLPTVCLATPDAEPRLHFIDSEGDALELTLSRLRALCGEEEVEVADPYHKRVMQYWAIPLVCVLEVGFERIGGAEGLRTQGLLLRALDGYTRPVRGEELLESGAFLAFGESALMRGKGGQPRFARIDRRGVDPGPFYLVWVGATQGDPHAYPWPYQLSRIEVASFAETFPRTVPKGLDPKDRGWRGYSLFQRSCAACHAINGEGGKIGPDLNVPRSIVEYRPIEQIRDYIKSPQTTRYTSMPPHPDLSGADLDALVAYFSAMSERKDDPGLRGRP